MNPTPSRQSIPRRRRSFSESGFTIMEVALASFVMALGLSTSILAMQAGYKFLDMARDTTLASQIIQSEIERIRMMSWDKVKALPPRAPIPLDEMFTSSSAGSSTESESETYTRTAAPAFTSRFRVFRLVYADPDLERAKFVRIITVVVLWTSFDGRRHWRRFEAKYVQQGLYDYFYTVATPPPST